MSLDEEPIMSGRRSSSNSQGLNTSTGPSSGLISPFPLSPEVDGMGCSSKSGGILGVELSPEDGFYTLKKDSQRRQTLTRVLSQDGKKICEVWLRSLEREVGQTPLTAPHLLTLMRGLRDYIPDQNKATIEAAISALREEVDFDVLALNHIQLALYLFQDAVSNIFIMDLFINTNLLNLCFIHMQSCLIGQRSFAHAFYKTPLDVCAGQSGSKCSAGSYYCLKSGVGC